MVILRSHYTYNYNRILADESDQQPMPRIVAVPLTKSLQGGRVEPTSFSIFLISTNRLSNIIAQKMSAEEQDIVAASSQQATENSAIPAAEEKILTKKVDVVRGAGPKHADATGFHLFNVVVHAASCSSSLWIFRAVFPGKLYGFQTEQKLLSFP